MRGSVERMLPNADLLEVTEQLATSWRELGGERVLFTGAGGFVGTWVLESLLFANSALKLGIHTTVISRDRDKFYKRYGAEIDNDSVELVVGDLKSVSFPAGSFSHVLHLATESPNEQHWSHGGFFINDQICSERVAEFCVKSRAERVLFTSSGAVYGRDEIPSGGFYEEFCGTPNLDDRRSAYGLGKRASEYIFNCLGHLNEVHPVIARLFSFSGPLLPMNAGYAFGNFIRDALNGEDIVIRGNGRARRSYLYAGDLATWIWAAVLSGKRNEVFNIGGSQVVSVSELAELVALTLESKSRVVITDELPSGSNLDYFPNVTKIKESLGVKEVVRLKEAVRRTANWVKEKGANAII